MVYGGILAGGLGTRMSSSSMPKQFIEIASTPIIVRTIRAFLSVPEIEKIIITMNPAWKEYCVNLLKEHIKEFDRVHIVHGGSTRFESLINLAKACEELNNGTGDPILITHDCARPFVSQEILKNNIAAVRTYDMVTTSIPTIDTVLMSKNQKEGSYVPDRHEVYLDQGPQTLNASAFLALVASLTEQEKVNYIEAGRLYLEKGFTVGIIEGERTNFKITTELDLKYAEFLISQGVIK